MRLKRRNNELKKQIGDLELKIKWEWKDLVRRRGIIEDEKVTLKKKINQTARDAREKIHSKTRLNEELDKR